MARGNAEAAYQRDGAEHADTESRCGLGKRADQEAGEEQQAALRELRHAGVRP